MKKVLKWFELILAIVCMLVFGLCVALGFYDHSILHTFNYWLALVTYAVYSYGLMAMYRENL